MHSPLNLSKDIDSITKSIDSLLEMDSSPKRLTTLWFKVQILMQRRELMRDGVGFSGPYSHVTQYDMDNFLT